MKRFTNILVSASVLAITFCMATSSAHAAVTTKNATTSSSLVGWWTFDEATSTTVGDFSGNGNRGTTAGTGGPTWVAGKRGGGMRFDGQDTNNNQTVVVTVGTTNPELAILGDVTISAWIKPSSSFFDTAEAILRVGQGSDLDYSMFYNPTNKCPYFHWYDGAFPNVQGATNSVPFDQWSHVTIVRSGLTVSFYVNGVFTNSAAVTAPTVAAAQLAIGRTNNVGVPQDYSGVVDDLRVYNRAFTAADVASLYSAGQVTIKPVAKNSLAAWWPFDEGTSTSVGDFSGNGKNFALINVAGTSSSTSGWNTGKRGTALTFDGIDDYALIPQPSIQTTPNVFTIAGWIYPNDQYARFLTPNSNGIDQWIGYQNTNQSLEFQITEIADINNRNRLSTAGSIPLNKWTHWAVSVNDKEIRIYINGVLNSSFSESINIGTWDGGWVLGQRGNSTSWFKGKLDDLRVYSRVLTADEVMALYKQNQTVTNAPQNTRYTGGLVGYWTFNGQDASTTIADVSGNGYHGYFIGSATSTAKTIGRVGQALLFNGSNNIVQLGTTDMGITSALTASAWIKTTSATSFMGIFGKDDGTNRSWKFGFSGTSGQLRFDVFNAGSNSSAISTSVVNDGNWHLVTATYDGAASAVYIDGVQDGSTPALAGGVRSSTAIVKIGTDGCCGGRNFAGPIDEVRLYNRALTATEVKQLYRLGR